MKGWLSYLIHEVGLCASIVNPTDKEGLPLNHLACHWLSVPSLLQVLNTHCTL